MFHIMSPFFYIFKGLSKVNFNEDIQISPLLKKKYRIYPSGGSHVDYGNINYDNFLIHKDKQK
jgi:hypothetical protein